MAMIGVLRRFIGHGRLDLASSNRWQLFRPDNETKGTSPEQIAATKSNVRYTLIAVSRIEAHRNVDVDDPVAFESWRVLRVQQARPMPGTSSG